MLLCFHFSLKNVGDTSTYYILEKFNQSCAGNLRWRQLQQKMTRVKLHLFLFHLKFVKMKIFFTILVLKKPNSEKRIFAVYKYSRRLLKRTLSPKCLSNNLSVWLFYDWLTPFQILIFPNLILHNFIFVSKSDSSVSKLFIFIQIRCILNLHQTLRQYQIREVV